MPSTTEKQRRLMEAAATPKGRAKIRARGKLKPPPVNVAREFRAADRAKLRKAKRKVAPASKRRRRG